jgi:hypothetical protein
VQQPPGGSGDAAGGCTVKTAVLSDTRLPTLPDGGHGLGMSAHDIATGLARAGHEITFFCGPGSEFDQGDKREYGTETEAAIWIKNNMGLFDAVLDTSHAHKLSRLCWGAPVLNRIADLECGYNPPNSVVNSAYMKDRYPQAVLVNTGIDAPAAFYSFQPGTYLLYASAATAKDGWHSLPRLDGMLGGGLRVMSRATGPDKWRMLAGASALVMLSNGSAAPRLPIEAGMMGTPVLCLGGDGAEHHVMHGITGFICNNLAEIVESVPLVPGLDRKKCREHMLAHHSYEAMIQSYDRLLGKVAAGQRW